MIAQGIAIASIALAGVGVCAIAAWTAVQSNYVRGEGWAVIGVILLISSCEMAQKI